MVSALLGSGVQKLYVSGARGLLEGYEAGVVSLLWAIYCVDTRHAAKQLEISQMQASVAGATEDGFKGRVEVNVDTFKQS